MFASTSFYQRLPGKAYAVNLGAYHARGSGSPSWTMVDDIWESHKLELQMSCLQDWNGLAACLTQFCRIDRDGKTYWSEAVASQSRYAA